jgi:hypothetical protein
LEPETVTVGALTVTFTLEVDDVVPAAPVQTIE